MAFTEIELSAEDVAKIDALDQGARLYDPKYLGPEYDWNFFPHFN